MQSGFATVTDFNAANDGELGILSGGLTKKIFRFDRVYTPQDGQGMRGMYSTWVYGDIHMTILTRHYPLLKMPWNIF